MYIHEGKAIDRLTWNTLDELIIIITINTMIIFNAGIYLLAAATIFL